jgi:hypothetical protein
MLLTSSSRRNSPDTSFYAMSVIYINKTTQHEMGGGGSRNGSWLCLPYTCCERMLLTKDMMMGCR